MITFESKQSDRLHRILIDELKERYSSKKLKKFLDLKRVRVNGKIETFGSKIIQVGDVIELNEATLSKPQFDPNRVLYEDEALFIYHKEPHSVCSAEAIQELFPQKLIQAHRLDRGTSGVWILCKSEKIAERLKEIFQKRRMEKTYLALIDGVPKNNKDHLETSLGKVGKIPGQTIYGKVDPKKGKLAILDFEVLESKENISLVKVLPLTGRTHQIRVQMALISHPVVLDHLYGKRYRSKYFASRTMLHCLEMKFDHPLTGKTVVAKAPLENDFSLALQELGFRYR